MVKENVTIPDQLYQQTKSKQGNDKLEDRLQPLPDNNIDLRAQAMKNALKQRFGSVAKSRIPA
jgi:hypothetical protein